MSDLAYGGGAGSRMTVHLGRALWITNACVVGVFTYLTGSRFFRGAGFGDFHVFHDAFRAVLAGEDLYRSGVGGYIYPPLFAVVFAPLGHLSMEHAGAVYTVLNGLTAFVCLWLAGDEVLRRFAAPRDRAAVPAVMLLTLVVFSDKLRIELQGGQTDLWILLCVLLALRWLGTRPLLAGFMLGLAGNLKYQTLIVLPYLLIRGRWRALGSCLASMAGLALSTAIVFGWSRNLDYLGRAFGGMARMVGLGVDGPAANIRTISWNRSISVPSVAARVQEWAGWPTWAFVAMTGVAAGLCLLAVLALYRTHGQRALLGRGGRADDATPNGRALVMLEWTGLLVAACVFGPQTNPRHMLLMMPVVTIAAMVALLPRPAGLRDAGIRIGRWAPLAACVGLFLAFVLPPGGRSTDHLVEAWRWIGGVSIATLVLLFVVVLASLRWARGLGPPPSGTAGMSTIVA